MSATTSLSLLDQSRLPEAVKLGSGATGTVYGVGKVAIKVSTDLCSQREYKIGKHLENGGATGFVRCYDLEGDCFSMERIDGSPLNPEQLTDEARTSIAGQVSASLLSAFRAGVIPQDLKSENTLISSDGKPVLIDFGYYRTFELPSDWDVAVSYFSSAFCLEGKKFSNVSARQAWFQQCQLILTIAPNKEVEQHAGAIASQLSERGMTARDHQIILSGLEEIGRKYKEKVW